MEGDVLEIAHFSQEGACCDDCEPDPQSPYQSTQDSDDFMTKELTTCKQMSVNETDRLTGGKEITNKIPTGINQPNLRLDARLAGVLKSCRGYLLVHPVGSWPQKVDELFMEKTDERNGRNKDNRNQIVPCPSSVRIPLDRNTT